MEFAMDQEGTPAPTIIRRLGSTPKERGSMNNGTCPDIFELSTGEFAVIGTDMTDAYRDGLPSDAGIADYERLVIVSRATLVAAKRDIPDA